MHTAVFLCKPMTAFIEGETNCLIWLMAQDDKGTQISFPKYKSRSIAQTVGRHPAYLYHLEEKITVHKIKAAPKDAEWMSQAQSNFSHLLVVPFISVVTMLVSVCWRIYTFRHTALKCWRQSLHVIWCNGLLLPLPPFWPPVPGSSCIQYHFLHRFADSVQYRRTFSVSDMSTWNGLVKFY